MVVVYIIKKALLVSKGQAIALLTKNYRTAAKLTLNPILRDRIAINE
jgi:hypothetical protein